MGTQEKAARRPSDICIVKAGASDAPAASRLIRQLARETGSKSPVNSSYVRTYLATPGCCILLARQASRILGLLSYSMRPGLFHAAASCVIEDLIVARDSRDRGVGGKLLAEVIRIARQGKCAEISVTAEKTNKGAARLYKRHGLTDEALFLEKHFP